MKLIILTDFVPIDYNLHSGDKNIYTSYSVPSVISSSYTVMYLQVMSAAQWISVLMFLFLFLFYFFSVFVFPFFLNKILETK